MDNTINALCALYVALGGNADDVADITIIPEMINAIASLISATHTLIITGDTGGIVVVERDGVQLANGAKIYNGDVLTISVVTGVLTVNGETFTSGDTITVDGDVEVVWSDGL